MIQSMFQSATVKLTLSYLAIIMAISILFSSLVFVVATREVSNRLELFQVRLEGGDALTLPAPFSVSEIRTNQTHEARISLFIGLVYVNLAVLCIAGGGSWLLAKRTLQPLKDAHDAQSRFTSDASHELKTPLATMKTEIEVALKDTSTSKQELRELLSSNLEEINKLSSLSQTLLQLSQLEYGDISLEDRIDVIKLINEVKAWYDPSGTRISFQTNRKRLIVHGNHSMARELLRIVMDNAVKYSPEGSKIPVTATTNGRTVSIVITNEGEGIPDDHLDHIFERFYRVDDARTSGVANSYGLGLALAKQITDIHGGTIYATSTPGRATSFGIDLPELPTVS